MRTWRWWSAALAPLGQPTNDGRILAVTGHWDLRPDAWLVQPRERGRTQLGTVEAVVRVGTVLHAVGRVWDTGTVAGMAAGVLRPQLELTSVALETRPNGSMYFRRGSVAAVAAGQTAAWPDVRFRLED